LKQVRLTENIYRTTSAPNMFRPDKHLSSYAEETRAATRVGLSVECPLLSSYIRRNLLTLQQIKFHEHPFVLSRVVTRLSADMTKLTVLSFFRCDRAKNVVDNRMRALRAIAVTLLIIKR
jgi:hypothetical protein